MHPSDSDVVNFLACYSVGRSYRIVNVARSMLFSILITKPGGITVGKNPLVTKLIKGLYNKSPPAAKYSSTWNPDSVLAYFDITAGTDLSLLELSKKTVTLLALCTLLRTAEISSINPDSIILTNSSLSFSLGQPRKAQHSGPLERLFLEARTKKISISRSNVSVYTSLEQRTCTFLLAKIYSLVQIVLTAQYQLQLLVVG